MRIAGIVAEYNPFHKGHADHILRTREAGEVTHVVAVMSGQFVQRGEPAAFPKTDRVRAALAGGADLVIELPLPWVLTSAEGFAFGAASLLEALGCVDLLSFGSECGEIDPLLKAAAAMEEPAYIRQVRYRMEAGHPAPEAQQAALKEAAGSRIAALLEDPNNTLGIEYIKALHRIGSGIRPFTVKRIGAGHDAAFPEAGGASASYLRRLAAEGRWNNAAPFMPRDSFATLTAAMAAGRAPADPARMERALLLKLRQTAPEQIAGFANVSEGLENRLAAGAETAGSLAELLEQVKTKRYPLARIRRLVWAAALEIPGDWAKRQPPYLRVLGMNERGRQILSAAKSCSLPLITRASQTDGLTGFARQVWELECRGADWYALTLPVPTPGGTEYTDGLVKME